MLAVLAAISLAGAPPAAEAKQPASSSKQRTSKAPVAKATTAKAPAAKAPAARTAAARKAGLAQQPTARAQRAQSARVATQAQRGQPARAANTVAARQRGDRGAGPAVRVTLRNQARGKAQLASARGSSARASAVRVTAAPRDFTPARVSIGQAIGLHATDDPLDLRSSVALVVDQRTGAPLFSKNAQAVLPIASITKLMTALVVIDSGAPMGETLEITAADIDTEKNSGSRLPPGTRLSRGEMLQLALMSSENRAANALGRNHPGGLRAFVDAMNTKARALGMPDTHFVEPTGLSSSNVSNARDLSRMVREALEYPLVRQFSTAPGLTVDTGYRMVSYRNTNRLISSPTWDIGLQKTGYISEAGSCLVMQVSLDGQAVVMVLLDATGPSSRFGDAQRLREWLEHGGARAAPMRTVAAPSFGS
jgi:D-alanyl-D-alanine endopeptidase (penicillin-binding protein 7)